MCKIFIFTYFSISLKLKYLTFISNAFLFPAWHQAPILLAFGTRGVFVILTLRLKVIFHMVLFCSPNQNITKVLMIFSFKTFIPSSLPCYSGANILVQALLFFIVKPFCSPSNLQSFPNLVLLAFSR